MIPSTGCEYEAHKFVASCCLDSLKAARGDDIIAQVLDEVLRSDPDLVKEAVLKVWWDQ